MSGPETLVKIRASADLARIPVLFMTARVSRADVEHYRALGAVGVIPKPFDPMRLATLIEEALG